MKKIYFLILLSISYTSQAQMVSVPDSAFRQCLLDYNTNYLYSYPFVGDQIDYDTLQSFFIQNLSCSGYGIQNVEGIQHIFFSGNEMDLSNNNIISIDSINNISLLNGALKLYGNPISCLPKLAEPLYELYIDGSLIQCIPLDYTVFIFDSIGAYLTLPTCYGGAGICNGNTFNHISGNIYQDINSDCSFNMGDNNLNYVPVKLYKDGLFQFSSYSYNGQYYLPIDSGNYQIIIDSNALPISSACAGGFVSNVYFNPQVSTSDTINFATTCNGTLPFDVEVYNAFRDSGLFFPGNKSLVNFQVLSSNSFTGLDCTSTTTQGVFVVNFTGPITYAGYKNGSLAPSSVVGNTITWNINDWNNINPSDFHLRFITDTLAQAFETACFNVKAYTNPENNNTLNDSLYTCEYIVTSYDPNIKSCNPINSLNSQDEYLTYKIEFQNTGTAAAQNIKVVDTLDSDLELSTFELLSTSHQVNTYISDLGIINFKFNNINLIDSNTNEPLSHGYVIYRIKLKSSANYLTTLIENSASIYFDYNSPIKTNTTQNQYITSVETINNDYENKVSIYPNPATESVNINTSLNTIIRIIDMQGKIVLVDRKNIKNHKLDVSHLASGIYIIESTANNQISRNRFVKM